MALMCAGAYYLGYQDGKVSQLVDIVIDTMASFEDLLEDLEKGDEKDGE